MITTLAHFKMTARTVRKRFLPIGVSALFLYGTPASAATPLGTAFTYQGQLKLSGSPFSALADFEFTLWDDPAAGNQVGPLVPANNVTVASGLFTVWLDFGASAFAGNARWLGIAVRSPSGAGAFTPLSPRQPLTAAPYALFSAGPWISSGGNVSYSAGNVGIGTTTPTTKLHVSGGNIRMDPNSEIYFDDNGQIRSLDNAHRILFRRAENKMELREFGDLIFSPGATGGIETAKVVMQASGNVGIGTLVPDARLTVFGPILASSAGSSAVISRQYGFPANASEQVQNAVYLQTSLFRPTAGADWTTATLLLQRVTDATPQAYLSLAGNNVGINTPTPGATLDVNGTARMFGFHLPTGAGANQVLTSDANGVGTWQAATGGGWGLTGNTGTDPTTQFMGTTDNQPLVIKVNNQRALHLQYASNGNALGVNILGGYWLNSITAGAWGATVFGGGRDGVEEYPNSANGHGCTVSGGSNNRAGGLNQINATVAGGWGNVAFTSGATVGGGFLNTATGDNFTTIGGGRANTVNGRSGTVSGGDSNTAGEDSTVGGGINNNAVLRATIAGGTSNSASGFDSTLGGGKQNIAGGQFSFIGGGQFNEITGGTGGGWTVIGGGADNEAGGNYATVGGGFQNKANYNHATVGGGNKNSAGNAVATVGGGESNTANASWAFVGGGLGNTAGGNSATVGGGQSNTASNFVATIGGGQSNLANGQWATVGGGLQNTASERSATVPGGNGNTAGGEFSFAAGNFAKANHNGSFVWSDSNVTNFASTANNQFNVRAAGGTRIFSNAGATTGVLLAAGGGPWSNASDRDLKTNFKTVDTIEVLNKLMTVPLTTWSYKASTVIRHIGVMAQDFHAAFGGLGMDDKYIDTVDADGVAFAAIQGLNRKVEAGLTAFKQENMELRKDNEAMARRLADAEARNAGLEARLERLEAAFQNQAVTVPANNLPNRGNVGPSRIGKP